MKEKLLQAYDKEIDNLKSLWRKDDIDLNMIRVIEDRLLWFRNLLKELNIYTENNKEKEFMIYRENIIKKLK